MTSRSLVLTLSVMVLVAATSTSVEAGFWKRKAEAEEAHQHTATASVKGKAANAYAVAMQAMHKNMRQPLAGNADVDFVRQMIPHHQGALDMARIQQRYGKDERLKKFNDWVIQAQTQEIAMMQNWLRRRDNGASPHAAEDYYGAAMKKMHHAMMTGYTGNADVDYARGMIAHHQGAVDMAEIWLKNGSDPDLKQLAHDVYSTQTQEIAWLQRWLEERGHHGMSH